MGGEKSLVRTILCTRTRWVYVMFVGVTFARAFLKNKGVFYLTQAMDANKSATFTENALT